MQFYELAIHPIRSNDGVNFSVSIYILKRACSAVWKSLLLKDSLVRVLHLFFSLAYEFTVTIFCKGSKERLGKKSYGRICRLCFYLFIIIEIRPKGLLLNKKSCLGSVLFPF